MRHDAHGFWLADAGLGATVAEDELASDLDFDVAIVGGGFTGMWTAWFLLDEVSPDRIALLEGDICGAGPSGRNGGFCHGFAEEAGQLIDRVGIERARALIEASTSEALAVGHWAREQDVDIEFRRAGELIASCSVDQDGSWLGMVEAARRLGLDSEFEPLCGSGVRSICDSPVLRGGVLARSAATLHPGRLALGLRRALIDRGVRVFEGTEVRSVDVVDGRPRFSSRKGSATARSGVIAAGIASTRFRGLRREATLTSSHMVITEPVPGLLEEIGWTDGQAIIDSRRLVHYFRTTRDGRIAFGWGGGRIGWSGTPGERDSVDRRLVSQVASDLLRFFPGLSTRSIEHAWGGPIDASPNHMPAVRRLAGGAIHAAFGYTGNGVGPSRSCARLLCALALDSRTDAGPFAPLLVDRPRRLPPEPFRRIGGSAIMRAIDSAERAGESGSRPGRIARRLSRVPDALGYRIGR